MSERFNADGLALSAAYAETMNTVVLPWLKSREQASTVPGFDQKPLHCVEYRAEQPRGTVVVVHGFTENAFKFSEVIYSLVQNGFDVVAYDQRGHGSSWRDEKVAGDTSLTHVGRFEEYVRDLEIIMDTVTVKHPKPWMVFCHSMGGAVTGLYLEKHPDVFSRAAFCAPMIQANFAGMSVGVVKLMCRFMKAFGQSKKRVFVSKPYTEREAFEPSCATSPERFDWYETIRFARKEFHNNSPTYSWTLESAQVTDKLLAPGAPERIGCPARLYTASLDNTVMPEPQKQFIDRVPQGSRLVVEGAKHEIYRSTDDVLFPWWHDVLTFLKGE